MERRRRRPTAEQRDRPGGRAGRGCSAGRAALRWTGRKFAELQPEDFKVQVGDWTLAARSPMWEALEMRPLSVWGTFRPALSYRSAMRLTRFCARHC